MARISTYSVDSDVIGLDRWIGSDWQTEYKATKNFTADGVAAYFNRAGIIDTGQFTWDFIPYNNTQPQPEKTFMKVGWLTNTININNLEGVLRISALTLGNQEPGGFIAGEWVGKNILVHIPNAPSAYAIYTVDSLVADGSYYYLMTLSFVSGASFVLQQNKPLAMGYFEGANLSEVYSVFGRIGDVVAEYGDYTTSLVPEGSNLYFTTVRSRQSISTTATGLLYTSATGILSLDTGYFIPTTTQEADWNLGYNNSIVSASVTGTSSKTLTLNQQDGGTISTVWSDYSPVDSVFGRIGAIVAANGDYNTSQVTELTNLYFTDARSRSAISLTTTGTSGAATYSSSTGILNIPQYQGGVTSFNTRTGAITLTSGDVTGALGFTPYNATNPDGFITSAALAGYVPTTRTITVNGDTQALSANVSFTVAGGVTSFNTRTGAITLTLGDVTGALGFTPYNATNPDGFITSAALAGYVPTTRTITINGDTQTLSANVSFTIASGVTSFNTRTGAITLTSGDVTTALGFTPENAANKGIANGYASLDSSGTVPTSQLPAAVLGGLNYQGVWNATTNTPALTQPQTGVEGYFYIVNVAGVQFGIDFEIGDWIVNGGNIWSKIDNTDKVASVFGRTGLVTAQSGDYTTSQVTEGTNLYYTNARSRAAISLTTTGTSGAATYNNSTGVLNIPEYQGGVTSFNTRTGAVTLTSGDVTTALGYTPQVALNGTGFVKISGTTISYDNTTYYPYPTGTIAEYVRGDGSLATLSIGGTLPAGGTAGQILSKIDATNYNTQWIDNFATQVKNDVKLGAALTKGNAVYVSGADGTNIIVSAASNTSEALSSKTFGLLETGDALNAIVKVVTYGLLAGLDTSAANAAGDPVWLGANGTLLYGLANKPYAPLHMVYIGVVTRKQSNNGEIFVNVQNGFELDELHNVSARTPSNNNILYYSTATSLWQTASIPAVLGYTPEQVLTFSSPLSRASNVVSIVVASSSANGYLSSTDWSIFNSKEPAITAGTNAQYFRGDKTFQTLNTSVVPEGSNLYYTNSRARLAIGLTNTGTSGASTYDNATGIFNIPNYQGQITLTTTGISGPATFSSNTLNIPQYSVSPSARNQSTFTATAGQTSFTIVGGYVVGLVDVFVNGSKYAPADFTATNGTTVVMSVPLLVGDIVDIINYTSAIAVLPTSRDVFDYTATASQTTFTVSGGYTVGLLDVYVNGTKLTSSEVTATNGTTFILLEASTVGNQVQAIRYNSSVNGVSGSGTANFVPKFTASGTIGNSSIQDSGSLVSIGVSSAISGSLTITGGSANPALIAIAANNGYGAIQISGSANYQINAGTDTGGMGFVVGGSERVKISNVGSISIIAGTISDPVLAVSANTSATISGNAKRLSQFRYNTGDATGIDIGYDATAGNGVIAGGTSSAGAGIDFLTYNGSAWGSRLTITKAGNVEINGGNLNMSGSGEINHTERILMDAGANNGYLLRTNNGAVNAMTIASAGTITFSSLGSGAVTATSGVLSTSSDMTLKVDDGYIDNALDKISKLTPRYFYWKEESGLPTDIRQLGFYAQEVNQALGEEAANTPKNENDKWGIYDRGIIAMLTKAIQELSAKITLLENK